MAYCILLLANSLAVRRKKGKEARGNLQQGGWPGLYKIYEMASNNFPLEKLLCSGDR